MVQIYNKITRYKHNYQEILINKKGVIIWITPFYIYLIFAL